MTFKEFVKKLRMSSATKQFSKDALNKFKNCQKCGESQKRLIAHHIEPLESIAKRANIKNYKQYSVVLDGYFSWRPLGIKPNARTQLVREMTDPTNALVLCDKCHHQVHKELKVNNKNA